MYKLKTKVRSLYILCVQDNTGKIHKVVTDYSYEKMLYRGIELSKKISGFWTIFNSYGRLVDGNFNSNLTEQRR